MFTNEMLQAHVKSGKTTTYEGYTSRVPADAITCKDGFRVSVQASETHYCLPRDYKGPYFKVELGFPSEEDELIAEYAADPDDLTGTVYGYVPVDVVINLINNHGGLLNSELLTK